MLIAVAWFASRCGRFGCAAGSAVRRTTRPPSMASAPVGRTRQAGPRTSAGRTARPARRSCPALILLLVRGDVAVIFECVGLPLIAHLAHDLLRHLGERRQAAPAQEVLANVEQLQRRGLAVASAAAPSSPSVPSGQVERLQPRRELAREAAPPRSGRFSIVLPRPRWTSWERLAVQDGLDVGERDAAVAAELDAGALQLRPRRPGDRGERLTVEVAGDESQLAQRGQRDRAGCDPTAAHDQGLEVRHRLPDRPEVAGGAPVELGLLRSRSRR